MTTCAKKTCWLIGAIFFFILGVIGIILPVIPQIPFLIIAFFCLSKGAPKVHHWIRTRNFYRKYVLKFERKCTQIAAQHPFLQRIACHFHH